MNRRCLPLVQVKRVGKGMDGASREENWALGHVTVEGARMEKVFTSHSLQLKLCSGSRTVCQAAGMACGAFLRLVGFTPAAH